MTLTEKAKLYAHKCHTETNHLYGDGKPYSFHLEMVAEVANQFLYLIPKDEHEHVIAGCWVHDCIEDCRQTYNDVKNATNVTIAELAYALTNEKGKTRKQRANDKYYEGIQNTPYATFIKLCDRIANVQYSRQEASSMREVYKNEYDEFSSKLYDEKYNEMFIYLKSLF
jgi:(p)ppGpp synthase/HD superfamily hydrolase